MYAVNMNQTAYEFFATRLVTTEEDKKKYVAQLKAARLSKSMYDSAITLAEKSGWLTRRDITDTVNVYRDFGYDVNRPFGEHRQNLLFAAAFPENYELLADVISVTSADVNLTDKGDVSILNIITQGNITKRTAEEYGKLLSLMMQKGLQIDAVRGCPNVDEKVSALMIAAHRNYYDRLRILIRAGAKPVIKNGNSKAAINFAKDLKIVKFLIDNGADPLNRDKWNQTAIFYQKDTAVIALLLANGVKINDQDVEGETALFSVTEPRVVEYLASRGIDINHINRKKQSVLETDVAKIMNAMRYDEDRQDEFIPKFRTLIKLGIDRTHVKNAFKMAESAKMYDLEKVIATLKPYAR
jgi:hypothetical protein